MLPAYYIGTGSVLIMSEQVTNDSRSSLSRARRLRYSLGMAEAYHCSVCDKTEDRCDCEKYCCLCQGEHQVRLCNDGLYYCLECREACDLQAQ